MNENTGSYELFVPACLLIGVALGRLQGEVVSGTLLGLGFGLFLMAMGYSFFDKRGSDE